MACPKQAQSVPVQFDYEGLNGLCPKPNRIPTYAPNYAFWEMMHNEDTLTIHVADPVTTFFCSVGFKILYNTMVRIMCKSIGSISQLKTRPLIGGPSGSTNHRPGFQLTYVSN